MNGNRLVKVPSVTIENLKVDGNQLEEILSITTKNLKIDAIDWKNLREIESDRNQ